MIRKDAISALIILFSVGYSTISQGEAIKSPSPVTRAQPAKLDRATYPKNPHILALEERLHKIILEAYPESNIEYIGQEWVVHYHSEKYQAHITDNGNTSRQPADRFPDDFSEFILRLSVEQDLMHYRPVLSGAPRPETFGSTLNQRYNLKEIYGTDSSTEMQDVPLDHWAYNAVSILSQAGVVEGYPSGQYSGNRAMTRYEFAVAIARSLQNRTENPAEKNTVWELKLNELLTNLQYEFAPELVRLGLGDVLRQNINSPKPIIDGQHWQPRYQYLSLRVSYGKGMNPALLETIQQVVSGYAAKEFADSQTFAINGKPIEVTLTPGQPTIMLGEPMALAFAVHNHSNQDFQVMVGGDYRNALGRPDSFTVSVTGKDGKTVPEPIAAGNWGGLKGPQKVPAQGSYAFGLFLPHWAVFEEPGIYTVTARRILEIIPPGENNWSDSKKQVKIAVQASTKIEVVPYDSQKMGKIIVALGEAILSGSHDKSTGAAHTLSAIQDARVVPYFAKLLEKRSSDQKFTALRVLGSYQSEEAFQALKRGMQTTGKDIGNTTTAELAEQSAGAVRHTAAHALARNGHPRAIPYLLTHRHDSSETVRMTILRVLWGMKPAAARPLLQEMTRDKSKRVSDEARRYLQLLPPAD